VTDRGLQQLLVLGRLQVLHLGETAVTNAGIRGLRSLKSLRELHVGGTAVDEDAVGVLLGDILANQRRRQRDAEDPDFAQTGLHVRSTIWIHRLLTVASSIIRRELGSLSPSLQARVAEALRRLFALESNVAGVVKAESISG
jgi:hypothetical protein